MTQVIETENLLQKYKDHEVARLTISDVLNVVGTKKTKHLFDGTEIPVNIKSLRLLA